MNALLMSSYQLSIMNFLRRIWQNLQQQFFSQSRQSRRLKVLILEPILTPSYLFGLDFGSDSNFGSDRHFQEKIERDYLDNCDLEDCDFAEYSMLGTELDTIVEASASEFLAGFFTVDNTGEIEIDFLFDGGIYQGEVAIFSLDGMDEFAPGSQAFIQAAALRGASQSPFGYTLTRDRLKTASGDVERGRQTLTLRPGDRFGLMFVPQGTVEDILTDPQLENTAPPLFSLATENPNDGLHWGQIIDLTGEGDTFMLQDWRLEGELAGDLIFKVGGAQGKAPTMDELDNV